jgi:hypothetical protein
MTLDDVRRLKDISLTYAVTQGVSPCTSILLGVVSLGF